MTKRHTTTLDSCPESASADGWNAYRYPTDSEQESPEMGAHDLILIGSAPSREEAWRLLPKAGPVHVGQLQHGLDGEVINCG